LASAALAQSRGRSWLAGDHHVHSLFSGDYPEDVRKGDVATYTLGADGIYPIAENARRGRSFGLSWMAMTDHGGPGLSQLHYRQSYVALQKSRTEVPDVVQFYGLELDTPGGDHASLILPMTSDERERLLQLETAYDANENFPRDPAQDNNARMLQALREMNGLSPKPLVFANHPSRGSSVIGDRDGGHTPADLRSWNNVAPDVAVGMEGAPGHQAAPLKAGSLSRGRGLYRKLPTYGGFDIMTAQLGGVWDAMLGEGRRWWITANSDSHRNFADGGEDFWPGQYSKTYVYARRDPTDILDGLRSGRIFVTTGDLISALNITASVGRSRATMGETLFVSPKGAVSVTISVREPSSPNASGMRPKVSRIDLILGKVSGRAADPSLTINPTVGVVHRFTAKDWTRRDGVLTMHFVLKHLSGNSYLRVRGTNGLELEPKADPRDENPWTDLWFYSNPIFLSAKDIPHA
jgi:hypothetical protein